MNAFLSIITLSYKECVFYNCRTKVNSAYAGNTCQNWQSRGQQRDYPRLRGEYISYWLRRCLIVGSPPLARGILNHKNFFSLFTGITPARAGNTSGWITRQSHFRDHPRSRGEYKDGWTKRRFKTGSPPLARGIQMVLRLCRVRMGITPARAGNTLHHDSWAL